MFGTGGNALVVRKIGEGKHQEARKDFSLLMAAAFIFSVVLTIISFIFLDPLCRFLGSDDGLLHYCREYMIPVLISLPFAVFGMVFRRSCCLDICKGKFSRCGNSASRLQDSCHKLCDDGIQRICFGLVHGAQ